MTIPGVYTFRVRARGETVKGTPFEREQTLTCVAVPGGDRWSPDDPRPDPLCELLDGLRRSGAFDDELLKRLQAVGIDVAKLLRCLDEKCRRRKPDGEGRSHRADNAAGIAKRSSLTADEVVEIVAKAIRMAGGSDAR